MKLSASIHWHGLSVRQRLPEGDALFRVFGAQLKAALDHTDAARTVADASDIEPVLRVGEALTFLANPVLDRHLDVCRSDLPRPIIDDEFLRPQQFHAGRFMSTMKDRDTAARTFGAVGRRNELREMRFVGVGDEALGAVMT